MSNTNTAERTTKIVIPGRFSYANVWEPTAPKGTEKKSYNVAILFPKKDKKTLELVESAIEAAKELGKATKKGWKGKIPTKLDLPLHDGDEERADDDAYAGMYYLNLKSTKKPGITKKVNGKIVEIIEQDEFYSGCFGYASINFFPYDNMNNGVSAGLGNLLKTKDGEALSGGSTPDEDFAGIDVSDDEDEFD